MMYKNLKSFLIHLSKNKLYSFISIFGFSVSLMFIILLSIFIQKEYSVDHFHKNKNRIYRLVHDTYSGFAPPSGHLLVDKFPEVETFTRTYDDRGGFVSRENSEKFKMNYLLVDSSFFNMFSFKLIKGFPSSVLKNKNSIVLTRSFAYKLFGKLPELGETIKLNDKINLTIYGIMEDFPENTHFQKVNALVDFLTLPDIQGSKEVLTTYHSNSFGLYLMARKNSDLPGKAPEILELFKEVNWLYKENYTSEVIFEPLTDVYFGNSFSPGIKQRSKTFLKIFTGIVLVILVLSIINYVNLTIAQSYFRSKEIAIKKLVGEKKKKLIYQSVFESILLSFFSFMLALFFSFWAEPVFNNLMYTNLELIDSFSWKFFVYSFLFTTSLGIISGIVPATKISKFNPIDVLKGVFRMKEKNFYSKLLISFQYIAIISLIISVLFINAQTKFLKNRDLGFTKNNIIEISNNVGVGKQEAFKEILKKIPGVEHVCLVKGTPIDGGNNNSYTYNGKPLSFQTFVVDTSFFDMMEMEVHPTGVAFSEDVVWLNESAVKAMELPENTISVKIYDKEFPIYGIVKDFHFRGLHSKIGPVYFQLMKPKNVAWSILLKINKNNISSTIDRIKTEHKNFTNGRPIELKFFDEAIHQWYKKEEKTSKIMQYFTILTIIISVMGLFAMSLYYIQQKTKEIGIRKVNGAKTIEIMAMLNKDFIKWVAIAFVLACPIAYYVMNKWLENFAYKTEISWWIFALAGLIALIIALLTVSGQSWRAATRNPIKSLRYE